MPPQLTIYTNDTLPAIYTNDTLPAGYAHQRRTVIRLLWGDIYARYPDAPVIATHLPHDRHFMITQGNALISSASITRREIYAADELYVCYGLASVMTFPAFRESGYGRQVVDAACEYARSQPDADLGILWTYEHLLGWYEQSGWEATPHLPIFTGQRDNPQRHSQEFSMWLFISDRAKAQREAILKSHIYVGETAW